jgi:hypothetical protein
LKFFASYWNGRLVDVDSIIISNVTSANSISVGSSFPYDHIIFPFCTRVDQDVQILNSELETATFTSLTSVGNDIVMDSNSFLSAANFSALIAIPGDLYIANNLQLLSANFMRVTRIDGSVSLINNKMLTSVVLSALTTIGGQLVYSNNPQLTGVLTPMLMSYAGRAYASTVIGGLCASGDDSTFTDALSCSIIVGNRIIRESFAAFLVNPVLTRAEGVLNIQQNNMLIRVDFASLTYVGGYLYIRDNSALTFATLPRLSQVQGQIYFCQNAPSFRIPNAASGTAAPPGLTSVGFKGTVNCFFQQGSGGCSLVTCP